MEHLILLGDMTFWIGAQQTSDDIRDWNWVDGTEMSYGFWNNGEPSHPDEQCGFIRVFNDDLRLFDSDCYSIFNYICAV